MGKRIEKVLSKEKNSSFSQEHTVDDSDTYPELYKCTGVFQTDFKEMCHRHGLPVIPPVVPRPRLPVAVGSMEGKTERTTLRGKQVHLEPEAESVDDTERADNPPKTFTTRDKFQYFMPSIQVEMDNLDKWETVVEIFVKGWKVDMSMMTIFQVCWPAIPKLHTINLWNTGLAGDAILLMSSFLPHCSNLVNLILDGNSVREENWACLIGEDSMVQHLSLRYCSITEKGARGLGVALASYRGSGCRAADTFSTSKLISLNLSSNLIDDKGAGYLASGLQMNRTLLSLSLHANKIGDKGAIKIAESLSRFPLTHEEVVARRREQSERGLSDPNGKSPIPVSRREASKDRPGSVRSQGTHAEREKKGSKPAKKKDVKTSKEDVKGGKKETREDTRSDKSKPSRTSLTSSDSGKSAVVKSKGKVAKKPINIESYMEVLGVINPLLEEAELIGGQLWVPGNRVLINLNLARNRIGGAGMEALLMALQYQTTLSLDNNRHSSTGLMRLCVQKNDVPVDDEVMTKIGRLMLTRDPLYSPSEVAPHVDST